MRNALPAPVYFSHSRRTMSRRFSVVTVPSGCATCTVPPRSVSIVSTPEGLPPFLYVEFWYCSISCPVSIVRRARSSLDSPVIPLRLKPL